MLFASTHLQSWPMFINDKPIGGYTDMAALEQSGELDRLLSEDA